MVKIKQEEPEEIEETEEPEGLVIKKRKMKRVANLDKDDYERVLIGFTRGQLKKLTDIAEKRDVSRGAIVRELVKGLPEKPTETDSEQKTETPVSDEDLAELLNACQNFFGGFNTTGDAGFFMRFAENGWKLNQLTDSQYVMVLSYLKTGYDGFMEKPETETFLEWINELSPSKDQKKLAKYTIENGVEFSNEDLEKTVKDLNSEIEKLVGVEEDTTEKNPSEKPSKEKPYWKLPEE